MTFIVACGGTGGHVFPGLVVARELKQRGHTVEVWFSGRDIEKTALGSWGGPVFLTGARPLKLRTVLQVVCAFFRCLRALKRKRPDVLLAMGSYASLPPVLAARMRHVPIVLHEANAVPGKAVDFLSRFAALTATSFEETAQWFPERKVVCTGLPVRDDLARQPRFKEIPEGVFTVFVTGGSQGARHVNALTSQALCLLKQSGVNDFFVIHQCGIADEARVKAAYAAAGVQAKVCAFLAEMGSAYASADLVICRAGASTCFELCRLGSPALLIPLPTAVRNHQHWNAAALVRCGGADEAIQSELSARSLMRYILNKKANPILLMRMRQALKTCTVPDAAARVADEMEKVARSACDSGAA
ncbi:MAG: UDP-N-acetylglucosamine--N-acetylmuramyl-(pentapeptide) pyrophosphoryl-undecaprenol N-acetylglucosamine transferase [bacterium]